MFANWPLEDLLHAYGITIVLAILAVLACYHYFKPDYDFWKRRNVRGPKPSWIFGNYKANMLGRLHSTELAKRLYDEYPGERMIGIFVMNKPVLILRDLGLVKAVLTKDFEVFSDRGIHVFDRVEPLSQHLFNLAKPSWLPLRRSLSPAFSLPKIKRQFGSIVEIADRFVRHVDSAARQTDRLECSALVAKFFTEIIGQYGFGLRMDEFAGMPSEFQLISRGRTTASWVNYGRRLIREYFPGVYRMGHLVFYNKTAISYYLRLVNEVITFRQTRNIQRKDYIGCLIDLKESSPQCDLSDRVIAAQAYVFFNAGTDTTAFTVSNALYEIAANPDVQRKLRDEIDRVVGGCNSNMSYDDIKSMTYLNMVMKETLRKYALRNIIRKSSEPYLLPGTNVTIPKDTEIIIPHYAIQRDARIYPEPDRFIPERFAGSPRKNDDSYLPFGDGPRKCIGEIFASIVSKIVIVSIVRNFRLQVLDCSYHKDNDPRKAFLFPKHGIPLKFEKL